MHVQIGDGLSVGDQESDCDDDDRRELISHYANDKYLSKWEVAEEEEEIEEETDTCLCARLIVLKNLLLLVIA